MKKSIVYDSRGRPCDAIDIERIKEKYGSSITELYKHVKFFPLNLGTYIYLKKRISSIPPDEFDSIGSGELLRVVGVYFGMEILKSREMDFSKILIDIERFVLIDGNLESLPVRFLPYKYFHDNFSVSTQI